MISFLDEGVILGKWKSEFTSFWGTINYKGGPIFRSPRLRRKFPAVFVLSVWSPPTPLLPSTQATTQDTEYRVPSTTEYYWILSAAYWILSPIEYRYWILNTGYYWVPSTTKYPSSTEYWILCTEYCVLNILHWILNTEYYWVLSHEYYWVPSTEQRLLLKVQYWLVNSEHWILLSTEYGILCHEYYWVRNTESWILSTTEY